MDPNEFETMLAIDERHWWYSGRRRVLRAVLDGLELPRAARVLDAGCGSGRTLDELVSYGEPHGMELNPLGVAAARGRGHADIREGRLEQIPFEASAFDLITCLDVVEHTPDDVRSLRELRRVARPGAVMVVTVPAHPRLWSRHDELNAHYRRYTRRSLRAAAAAAGWRIERLTGFNAMYLVPAALVRIALRGRDGGADDEPRSEASLTPAALDAVLELPLRLEAALVRRGANLPTGLSLLAVMRAP
jgi:SAM-dependent methyltransferase